VSVGLELGTEIGGYRLESVLGEGGMGTVFLARSPQGGPCALKVLSRSSIDLDPSLATRFEREAEYVDALEALDHPNLLELFESGQTSDGTLFFAMQYVDGPDLAVVLRRDGVLSLSQALAILGQIGDALDCAHASGLVHRDVKPANIVVARDPGGPHAYLTDFGLSKNRTKDPFALTQLGQLVGTLPYTAPEEILDEESDHRVDVYSLGCVLYEAVVGAPPFVREREIDVLYAHIGDPRPSATAARPDLPAGIDEVIAKAMAISATDRYASCAEFIAAAQVLLPEEERASSPPAAARDDSADTTLQPAEPGPAADQLIVEHAGGPPGSLRLVVRSGPAVGRVVLIEDEMILGRLSILGGALASDHNMSRRHARISRASDGSLVVEDEHSRNGTFVNEARIDGPHALRAGDRLMTGGTVFEAEFGEPVGGNTVLVPVDSLSAPQSGDGQAREPGGRLALRLEFDSDEGELIVAIENGASIRIVREDGAWRVAPA